MEVRSHIFNEKEFKIIKGTTHPEYSFFTFEGEEKDFREKYWNINDKDIVFDIGCSYGAYTLSACAMGATVYAFEPEKTVFVDLVNNIAINDWNDKSYLYNIGLWDSENIIDMKDYAPHWPTAAISGNYNMSTLDNIIEKNSVQKINWMKIDVEGAEENVIKGGLKSINKFLPKMIIECHTFLNEKIKDNVKQLLCDNYNFEEIDRPPCIMIYATPKAK